MNLATSIVRPLGWHRPQVRSLLGNLTRMLLALCLTSVALAPSAHADLAPPRIQPLPKPTLPPKVKAWFTAARAAMKTGLAKEAEALCDTRGFELNLVGGDGTSLASLFAQGHRKRWHLRAELAGSKPAPGPKGSRQSAYIAKAEVIDDLNDQKLDSLFVLLVPGPNDAYVALGASESRAPIEALAKRWQNGDPLPPKED